MLFRSASNAISLRFSGVLGSLDGFSGSLLPSSTFFYDRWAMSDRDAWFGFTASQEYAKATYSDYIKQRDEEWIAYLNEHAGENVMSCLFQSKDTLDKLPCAVMCIPLKDELAAERCLQSLLYSTPKEEDAPLMPKVVSNNSLYPKARRFSKYVLPRNTLLTQLTGITESALYTFACFMEESDRKSTRLNSSHIQKSRMPSSA